MVNSTCFLRTSNLEIWQPKWTALHTTVPFKNRDMVLAQGTFRPWWRNLMRWRSGQGNAFKHSIQLGQCWEWPLQEFDPQALERVFISTRVALSHARTWLMKCRRNNLSQHSGWFLFPPSTRLKKKRTNTNFCCVTEIPSCFSKVHLKIRGHNTSKLDTSK